MRRTSKAAKSRTRNITVAIAKVPSRQIRTWHIYPEAALLQKRAGEGIAHVAVESITAQGAFRIVLAGGTTPRAVYEHLRDIETDWTAWHVYFGDERCLSADHASRNSVMAFETWLGQVAIPAAQIHAIPAELGAQEAAQRYAMLLAAVDQFDLVLLGLGEDGHTASLFPGQDWGEGESQPAVLAVYGAPKPPSERVSLSAWRLGKAKRVWFMVTGSAKKNAVEAWRRGENIPAAAIRPVLGVDVFIEAGCLGEEKNA